MAHPHGAESPREREQDRLRSLRPEPDSTNAPDRSTTTRGSGPDSGDAGKIVDALKASADQEFSIAERLSAKSRQGFALAVGFFVVAQTVAFSSFEATELSSREKEWIIRLAI